MSEAWLFGALEFFGAFLISTCLAYWVHRLAHMRVFRTTLWKIHEPHHRIDAWNLPLGPDWRSAFLWYGGWRRTADVVLTFYVPALIAGSIIGGYGWLILPFHYLYELFCADGLLDHNPRIKGRMTRMMAIGDYHLAHHHRFNRNLSFIVPWWDHLFGTVDHRVEAKQQTRAKVARGTGSPRAA